MAVTLQNTVTTHIATGAEADFAYEFRILSAEDLIVTANGSTLTRGVDYSVQGVGQAFGGSIKMLGGAPAAGTKVQLRRATRLTRSTDYQTAGDFKAQTVNPDFDRPMLALQDLAGGSVEVANTLRAPAGETFPALPAAAGRVGRLLSFDEEGRPVARAAAAGSAEELALSLASTEAGKGAALVGFKQSGALAALRTAEAKLRELGVSIADFGGSTLADAATNAAALQAAIDSLPPEGGCIRIKPGIWPLAGRVTNTNKPLVIEGEGMDVSVLRWTGGTVGIKHTSSTSNDHQLTIRGLTLENGVAGGIAIEADFSGGTQFSKVTAHIENVTLAGNGGHWTEGVKLTEGRESFISNVRFKGAGRATSSIAINLVSESNSTNYFIEQCLLQSVSKGIHVYSATTSGPEGLHCEQTTFVDVDQGVLWRTAGSEPLMLVTGCHFDAMVNAIDASQLMQFIISANHFQKGSGSTVGNGGILLAGCSEGVITGNMFVGNTGTGDYNAIVIDTSSHINVADNTFRDLTTAVWFKAGAANCRSDGQLFRGVTNPLVDQGTSNFGASSAATSGYYVDHSGMMVQWGSAVITTDANGEGSITLPKAFPAAYYSGVACLGDAAASGESAHIKHGACTASTLVVRCTPNPGTGIGRRINFWTVGK